MSKCENVGAVFGACIHLLFIDVWLRAINDTRSCDGRHSDNLGTTDDRASRHQNLFLLSFFVNM